MFISNIAKSDVVNGLGVRVSVFVSGCTNHCEGCFSPQTWDFNYGFEWTKEDEDFVIKELSKPYYKGLTLLGGDPFEFVNQEGLISLLRRVKKELPEKDVWAYTGFVYDKDLCPNGKRYGQYTQEMLSYIDVLIDGPFVLSKRNITLKFRGSDNQRIIDVKESIKQNKTILWKEGDYN